LQDDLEHARLMAHGGERLRELHQSAHQGHALLAGRHVVLEADEVRELAARVMHRADGQLVVEERTIRAVVSQHHRHAAALLDRLP